MTALLNIGSAQPNGQELKADKVIAALWLAKASWSGYAQQASDSELTYVLELDNALSPTQLDALAVLFDQEAVAQWDNATNSGVLRGPKAKEWGPFDPARFVLLNGDRLNKVRTAA